MLPTEIGQRRPEKLIKVEDRYYILADSSLAEFQTRVLKHGDTFGVFDRYGDIEPARLGEQGIFHEGTRYLSRLIFELDEDRPVLLSSTVNKDNILMVVDLTNPDYNLDGELVAHRGALHFFRSKFLWNGNCYERLRISNYGLEPITAKFKFEFDADYADIFEVRGLRRERRGVKAEPVIEERAVVLGYCGLDDVIRKTRVEFSHRPVAISASSANFEVILSPKEEMVFYLTVTCESDGEVKTHLSYDNAFFSALNNFKALRARDCEIITSNEQFNDWINTSICDLHMMTTETAEGSYPYAGVPWFSTQFGRDGIITALETLWVNPTIARGVLGYLSKHQATETRIEQEAEPGKILHEVRLGEMASLKEIPFGLYYGSIDSTPLFLMLAGAYYERTADKEFISSIWPNIEAALEWMDKYGDMDGDGFLEYQRKTKTGLQQQGWKDSHDSVFHADGTYAEGPIALCEVQGYAYAGRLAVARIAASLGKQDFANRLADQAAHLRVKFEQFFWSEELSTYVMALDGNKVPCKVRSSNAGHALFTGIAEKSHARRTAATLLDPNSFSGWGIRTIASVEARYNPMAYHNGSIWPHDNALIAAGFARYGLRDLTWKILSGLFDASLYVDLHRLPELFCGFVRRDGEGPTLYPVACSPQAWAAGSVFMLLQSSLGLTIEADKSRITFLHPFLPQFLRNMTIKNIRVGNAVIDLSFEKHPEDVGINVIRREGDVEIVVVK